jgi:hypothetical protein
MVDEVLSRSALRDRLHFKFAIGSQALGQLSPLWNVASSNTGHVMMSVRAMQKFCKLNMHASRWCSFGPTPQWYDRMPDRGIARNEAKRALITWKRPEADAGTPKLGLIIVEPSAYLYARTEQASGPISWVPPPDNGMCAAIGILFTRAETIIVRDFAQVLGAAALCTGETVFICVKYEPFDMAAHQEANEPNFRNPRPRFLTDNRDLEGAGALDALLFDFPREEREGHCTLTTVSGLRVSQDVVA